MAKYILTALAALPLLLSACSERSADGEDDSGSITIGTEDEDGKFSIEADGFSMDVDIPSITIDSEDFDLNNVTLYPGTKVTGMKIEDVDGEGGKVILDFVAPVSTDVLLRWFESKMAEEDFTVSKEGTTLSGATDDGDLFMLSLSEVSEDETKGKLEFSEEE